jgi:hypothetical protein
MTQGEKASHPPPSGVGGGVNIGLRHLGENYEKEGERETGGKI